MTTTFFDIPNSDVIVFMGSNAAENHPIGFKWFMRAKQKGAKIIVLDPRLNRTAAKADMWVPFRPGTDIAVLGGLVRYAVETGRIHTDYVVKYTNASFLVDPNFTFQDGLFSGWDSTQKVYNQSTWKFQLGPDGKPLRDETLQNPQTVYQQLRKIYSLYTPEKVSEISGIPTTTFLQIADLITGTHLPARSALFAYAMGWTQHTKGVQNIRAATILQMLLGNIGMPGGGIAALRGHSNVQGATDMAVLYHDLPGYLGQPTEAHKDLNTFLQMTTPKDSYWVNKPAFMVSLLKAWWGAAAHSGNDWAFHYLPKMGKGTFSHYDIFQALYNKTLKGLFVFGQNPAVGSANATKVQKVMANLDWLVEVDMFQNETSDFWKLFGNDPGKVKTEVFLLPAAAHLEKDGSYTNTMRLIQWKHKAIEPLGEGKSDAWYVYELGKRLKARYVSSTAAKDAPIRDLVWNYAHPTNPNDVDFLKILAEINGYYVSTGERVSTFAQLKSDGTTAAGCWIYSGVYSSDSNRADSRVTTPPNRPDGWTEATSDGTTDYLHKGWGFAWPANRRVLYNRASADPSGNTWSKTPLVWWDAAAGKWTGVDVPDMLPVAPDGVHPTGVPGSTPFLMKPLGAGALFGPLADGPIPVHYEPVESPVGNGLYANQKSSPTARLYQSSYDTVSDPSKYPFVVTTYRVTEHHLSGVMTRNLPFLAEAFPWPFVEISPELAAAKGIRNGDWAMIENPRGRVKVRAMVTRRIKPLTVAGRQVETIGLPIHWAPFSGLVHGDIVNTLVPQAVDVNVQIQESKAFLATIYKA